MKKLKLESVSGNFEEIQNKLNEVIEVLNKLTKSKDEDNKTK